MNRISSRWTALALILVLILTGCEIGRTEEDARGNISGEFAPPGATQNGVVLRLQPSTQQLNVGETANIELLVDNVTNLYGADLEVQFAPSVLQVVDSNPNVEGIQITPGPFLSSDYVVSAVADNGTGLIRYIVNQTAPAEPASGSGVLASFTVQAVGMGESIFGFSTTKLSNPDGQAILPVIQITQITVGQPGQPTSTPDLSQPTATLTAIPGLSPTVLPATETPTPTVTPLFTMTPLPTMTPTFTPLPPPTATPSPIVGPPPGATLGFCYRVQPGDTLYSLAQANGTSVQNIQIANDLYPPGYIYPQKALFIPTQMGAGPNFYVAQSGDTFESIADVCNLPADFLIWVNEPRLGENPTLTPGEAVEIPIPPFPPPARYPYPPPGPPPVYPPPSFYGPCGPPC